MTCRLPSRANHPEARSSQHINADLFARMDAGLAHLENGLRL